MDNDLYNNLPEMVRIESRIAVLEANDIHFAGDLAEIKQDLYETKRDSRTAVVRSGQNIITMIVGFTGIIVALLLAIRHQ